MNKYIQINAADTVAVAIIPLLAGDKLRIDDSEITLLEDIPAGHKVALKSFARNEHIIKYYMISRRQSMGIWFPYRTC